jgi:hypothetical protein
MLAQVDALGTFCYSAYHTGAALLGEYSPAPFVSHAPLPPTPAPKEHNALIMANDPLGSYFDGDIWLSINTRKYDFGLILEEQILEMTLFNSAYENRQLSSIYPYKDSGFTLSGISAPYTFHPLEEVIITFTVSPAGDLDIGTAYTFTFEGQSIIVMFFGTRLAIFKVQDVVFKQLPQMEYAEGEILQTDIFTAQNGKETRQSLIEKAKKYVEYKIIAKTNAEAIELQEAVTRAMKTFCYQPLWFSRTIIKENARDTITVKVDTVGFDFELGGMVMIQRADGAYIFASIYQMSDTTISFERIIDVDAGWMIVPIIKASPENSNSYTFTTSRLASWTLKLKELL